MADILRVYEDISGKAKATLDRLEKVRQRGRKRDMFG
jgi:tRNA A-37 threonylcarbamoyl transferase component Bud32